MDQLTAIVSSLLSSKVKLQSSSATSPTASPRPHGVFLLQALLLLAFHALLRLLRLLLSPGLSVLSPAADDAGEPAESAAARALSHVLALVSRVPVASRKYELVRGLAERLLDDNLRVGAGLGLEELNRAALCAAFARTVRRLESAFAETSSQPLDRPLGLIVGSVRAGIRKLVAVEGKGEGGGSSAEKLAAEALWLAGKMAQCGVEAEAVARWGAAEGLSRAAIAADPRLQVALVRLTAFLFKHVDAKVVEGRKCGGEEEQDQELAVAQRQVTMLTSWLPLLCRASNGTDAPILSSSERAEMARVLEDTIQKLSWEKQEEVLALWLHHFTSSPNSDWPNLESSYTRWYAESLKLLLK